MRFALLFSILLNGGSLGLLGGEKKKPEVSALQAGTTTWVLSHLFHLDAGNTSSIIVTNHSTSDTVQLRIAIRSQAPPGSNPEEEVIAQVAPQGTRRFDLGDIVTEGFVGTAVVFCGAPCLTTAIWNFDLNANRFAVGVPATQASAGSSSTWATSTFDPDGRFALAVFNNAFSATDCEIRHFNEFGDPVGDLTVFTLEPVAQRAEFAQVPAGFVGRSVVDCDGSVWVTPVLQNPINGFPTVGSAMDPSSP